MITSALVNEPTLPIHCQLAEIWSTVLGVEVLSIDVPFSALGGDQTAVAAMLQEVASLTGRQISVDSFLAQPTIRGLADTLILCSRAGEILVEVQPGQGLPPVFFFHGDILGGGFYSRRLAEMLGPERPFFVSPPLELYGDELPDIEEIASRKRHALMAKYPQGPFILGGYCVGAVVAYETARQLVANGREVQTVVMIEPEVGDAIERSHLRVLDLASGDLSPREKVEKFARMRHTLGRIRHAWKSPLTEKAEFVWRNSLKLLSRNSGGVAATTPYETDGGVATASYQGNMGDGIAAATPYQHGVGSGDREWLLEAYSCILASYIPRPYSGRVNLLVTRQNLNEAPHVTEQFKKAAPASEVHEIPGNHLQCITTHLESLGKWVQTEVDEPARRGESPAISHPLDFSAQLLTIGASMYAHL